MAATDLNLTPRMTERETRAGGWRIRKLIGPAVPTLEIVREFEPERGPRYFLDLARRARGSGVVAELIELDTRYGQRMRHWLLDRTGRAFKTWHDGDTDWGWLLDLIQEATGWTIPE